MILNINKDLNWTSFDVVAKVRGIYRSVYNKKIKVGHAGTLDPLATGVLLVLTDKDTKKQDSLMTSKKEYECLISFGITSETYDLEGPVSIGNVPSIDNVSKALSTVLKKYIGEITQTVPAFSAIKVNGERLYKKARNSSIDLNNLPSRVVNIYDISLLDVFLMEVPNIAENLPTAKIRVTCSKGTYIRSLANDIGVDIGFGATLTGLVRTKVGDFKIEDSLKIDEVKDYISSHL